AEGVEYVGPLPQAALAKAVAAADVHAYPCTFPETACIAAMEAMAAGAMIVTTRLGALEETTAGHAFLLGPAEDGRPLADRYAAFLSRRLLDATEGPAPVAGRLAAQRAHALEHYRWDKRAAEWEDWLAGFAAGGKRARAAAPAGA